MNGVGKLLKYLFLIQSLNISRGDSTWWNLSAYSYYSQTYPLPGPFSKLFFLTKVFLKFPNRLFHHLTKDIHQLTAAFTLSTQVIKMLYL